MYVLFFFFSQYFVNIPNIDTCESGWEPFGGYCYYFAHTAWVTFLNAQAACQTMSSNLVSIHSQEEQAFIAGE